MKELLAQYAEYNIWANNRIIDVLLKLEHGSLDQEIPSSFSSLRATVYHTWGAENIWLQRLQLVEYPAWVATDFAGTFAEACADWQRVSGAIKQFVDKQYDDKALTHVLQYYDLKKNSHKTPVFQVLQHVFNHSTYHRGQLVTMLRQAGQADIPSTDFIAFARKK
jgi:uncharacterized damage-inducible protein DinB